MAKGRQFTVGDAGAAEGGRGLLAASLGDTATTPQRTHSNQPKPNQGRSWVSSSLRRFKNNPDTNIR
jgi:hypothetical protein